MAPGESLEFLAQIRGWHSEDRKQRRARLLQLNNIGLRDELDQAAGTDVFFIPKEHFAKETLESRDEGLVVSSAVSHAVQGVPKM